MADFGVKRGDRLPILASQLKDANGTAVNLSTASSVTFFARLANDATNSAPEITGPAVVEETSGGGTARRGWVDYIWAAGDTDHAGDYLFEWKVTWPDGKEQTFPTEGQSTLKIWDDLESHLASIARRAALGLATLVPTQDDVDRLRVLTAENNSDSSYTDQSLTDRLTAEGSINKVASDIWMEKASRYALVSDVAEAGSSRPLSKLYVNALGMADYYRKLWQDEQPVAPAEIVGPRTRPIVRP